ncbi:MAG: chromosome segregation protein SMC [Candidatus Bathyarchaeota archaeon]|nr:MAG: chromosome segregation protein SMC [Candidatus Bathyarchaeota archaeon]
MVYIKKLEMRGFKSFGPKKVTLSLDKGYTVVSGPNGSGKSNVIDAIRFVLGELSARSLRAGRFAEVIFDGSKRAKKSQIAIVNIEFDNTDRRIPIDLDTVSVSRRVSRDGQSIYQLNGRNISRSQLTNILAVGGLHSKGHNIIMQGTVTRLADLTSEDRRKIVEDLTGIAEYDAKRSEAQVQLNQAEFNLRVAAARIEEVEKRMAALERERNDAIRHDFLSNEIRRLRGQISSRRLDVLESELDNLRSRLQEKRELSGSLRETYENLQQKREKVESEWRRFNEDVVEKGGTQLFSVQEKMGDISAQIASLQSEMDSNKARLRALSEMREKERQHSSSLRDRIREVRRKVSDLAKARKDLELPFEKKQKENKGLTEELEGLREVFSGSGDDLKAIDEEIETVTSKLDSVEERLQSNRLKSEVLFQGLKPMETRYSSFSSTVKNLEKHIENLEQFKRDEKTTLEVLDRSLDRSAARRESVEGEIFQAEKTASKAKGVLVEFETKSEFLDVVSAEENALRQIEEMGDTGAIRGILGRVEDFLKPDPAYERPIKAASEGWMKAIVVEDLEVAARCIESLRRTKLGRIKLIPLKNLGPLPNLEPPHIRGVVGLAFSFVKTEGRFSTVARYLLGDTVVVSSEDTARRLSAQGFRCVTLTGDLFEAGGGLESGYYRAPVELSQILPSISAIKSLEDSVEALEDILQKRREEMETLLDEESRMFKERSRRLNAIETLDRETETIQTNITMVKNTLRSLSERISETKEEISMIESTSSPLETDRTMLTNELDLLKKEWEGVAPAYGGRKLTTLEATKAALLDEINNLQNQIVSISGEISTFESNLQNTLQPEFERSKLGIRNLGSQIAKLENTIEETNTTISTLNEQLNVLQKTKDRLSVSISSIREERRRFETMLDEIDEQIKEVNTKYEPVNQESHQMELEVQRKSSEHEHVLEELKALGFENRLKTSEGDIEEINDVLNRMRDELATLGSVNLLAIDQYSQQVDAYKQLSIRRNEVETEKISILDFMDEIEQRKRNAFMDAYSKIDTGFRFFFSKLTGGGNGWLELENNEDPFAGGLDIYVEFPGKSARLVSGASGGEKSVSAVAFMFAVQDLSPAPFYVFDEVDAHLDIHNAERLADMLLENSSGTQFIVISLRDVVVDRAQKLFGVYAQDGVSKVVSIELTKTVGE